MKRICMYVCLFLYFYTILIENCLVLEFFVAELCFFFLSFSDIFIMNNILLFWFRLALTWVNIWPSQTFVWGLKFIALCQG